MTMHWTMALATAGLWLAAILAGGAGISGCSGDTEKKDKKEPKVIDWQKKWDQISDDGEMGKHFIKQGMNKVQAAQTEEARDEGYKDMVRGFRQIMEAQKRGEDLIDQIKDKDPGKTFPEWEKQLASWTENAMKVRKNVPMEYFD